MLVNALMGTKALRLIIVNILYSRLRVIPAMIH